MQVVVWTVNLSKPQVLITVNSTVFSVIRHFYLRGEIENFMC